MKTKFVSVAIASAIFSIAVNAQTSWQITGNSNITNNNFIGTTNKTAFKIRTNNAVRVTITSAGNTGIGTATPKSKLDVAGGITAYSSYFTRLDGAPGVSVGRSGANYGTVGYGLTFTDTTDRYRYNISDFSSMLTFRAGGFDFNTAPTGTAGNTILYTTAMTILQNGNVGIGTNTPANRFSLQSSSFGKPVAFIENTDASTTSSGMFIKVAGFTGTYFIAFLSDNGSFIGHIDQANANNVNYSTTSDKRLKNIIGTSQKGLTDLMKIKVYDYSFKSDPNKKVQSGFMAQELYEIFPQAVSKPRDSNEPAEKDPWMIDYGRVTPLIIKSVQEQQQIIDELKKQNEKLQKQIDELKVMMISMSNEKDANNQTASK